MPHYRIRYTETEDRIAIVEADSESAARQCWIDSDVDGDELVEAHAHITDIQEFDL